MRTAFFRRFVGIAASLLVALMLTLGAFAAAPARAAEAASRRSGYAIVVPAAMTQTANAPSLQRNPNVAVSTFAGWPNADHTAAKFVYGRCRLPAPPSSGLPPLSEMTAFFLKTQIAPLYKGLTIESKSAVRLAGLTFDKVVFHGRCAGVAHPEQGFIYIAYDGSRQMALILGEDEEPYSGEILPVLERAALTLSAPAQTAGNAAPYAASVPSALAPADFPHASARAFTAGGDATDQLARARTLVCGGNYSIRLPCGYTPYTVPSAPVGPGSQISAFRSINPNSTHPVLLIYTAMVSRPARTAPAVLAMLSEALNSLVPGLKVNLRQYRQYPVERGSLGGVPYYRVQYQGVTATESCSGLLTSHGFAYVGYDHGSLVCIFAENFAPYSARTLPLQEASALSLTRCP